jgi:hypothetical protein
MIEGINTTIQKVWNYKGLPCVILFVGQSHLCGYVGVTKDYPTFQMNYTELPVKVHGGLTYAGDGMAELFADKNELIRKLGNHWWFGFDCCHAGDKVFLDFNNPEEHTVYTEARREHNSENNATIVELVVESALLEARRRNSFNQMRERRINERERRINELERPLTNQTENELRTMSELRTIHVRDERRVMRNEHMWTVKEVQKETEKLADQLSKITYKKMFKEKLEYMPDWFRERCRFHDIKVPKVREESNQTLPIS